MISKEASPTGRTSAAKYDEYSSYAEVYETGSSKRVSWGAIFAGTIATLIIQVALEALGTGIGASTINPAADSTPNAQGFGIGTAAWVFVSTLISLYAGAWIAGRLSNSPRGAEAALHGITVWGVSTLAVMWLLTTTIGGIFGGTAAFIGQTMSAGAQGLGSAASSVSGQAGPGMQNSGIDVNAQARGAQRSFQQTVTQNTPAAKQVATDAATGVSRAGIGIFILLLLGGIVSWYGGSLGPAKARARHAG